MLTITELSPSLAVKKAPLEGNVKVGRYIKRLNPKPHDPPLVLIEIVWAPEATLRTNFVAIDSFLKSAAKQHDKEISPSTHRWNCKTCDTLETARSLSSRHISSQCPGQPPRKDFFAELVDTVAAICIKTGIAQWTVDNELMVIAASHEETGDKDVCKLAGLLDTMPIETPAASAGHKKRKSDFDADDEEGYTYQQFRSTNVIATTGTRSSSQLGETPFL